METTIGDGICIIDRDGMIIWANPAFIEWFSHRTSVIGMMFNQLFPGAESAYRQGVFLEDRDKLGRRRFFKAECLQMSNANGDRISEVVLLHNVTLMKTLTEISKLSTQTTTPKEFFEKVLWLMRDTYAFLGLAGFIARGNEVELIASKGWTEKLKSMIGVQPIAPDSLGMAGRSAYHRTQMLTTIQDYSFMPDAKRAIERIGGEFLVVTPLMDHERLVGVLTVIHSRELTSSEQESLQSLCSQIAVSLNVRLHEEELTTTADDARLYVDLIAHNSRDAGLMIRYYLEVAAASKPELSKRYIQAAQNIIKQNDESIGIIRAESDAGGIRRRVVSPDGIIRAVISDAENLARVYGKKISIKYSPCDKARIMAGPLFRDAVYQVLSNSIRHSRTPSLEVDIRIIKDRSGMYRLEISDNGPGIPDEMKSEVFRREKSIPGIGLSIVKSIILRYGGRVWIEDRIPGNSARGTRVVIVLTPARA